MRTTGVVKWYNRERGLGFITPDERGADVFLHHSAIEADGSWPLSEGDRVEYERTTGPKGPQASNVRRL